MYHSFTQRLREIKIRFDDSEGNSSIRSFVLDDCHPEVFNSEIVMECLKRTSDLHTTQQCLMLLSKGAQLFPVRIKIRRFIHLFIYLSYRKN